MAKAKSGNHQKYSTGGKGTETPGRGAVTPRSNKAKHGDHDSGETAPAKSSPYRATNPNEYGMADAANQIAVTSGQGSDIAGFEPSGGYTEPMVGNLSAFASKFEGAGRMTAIDKGPAGISAGGGSAHPGFQGAARKVAATKGIPMDRARAIIGASSHHASAAAIRKNPRLKRVPGVGGGD